MSELSLSLPPQRRFLIGFFVLLFPLLLLHITLYAISPFEGSLHPWAWLPLAGLYMAVFGAVLFFWLRFLPEVSRVFLLPKRMLSFLLVASVFGAVLHIGAKLALINWNYMYCLSSLRDQWLQLDDSNKPTPIFIASMLGHVLTPLSYAGVFLVLATWGQRTFRAGVLWLLAFLVLGVVYAFPMLSRSSLLLLLVVIVFGGWWVLAQDFSRWKIVASVMGVVGFLFFAMALLLFVERAACHVEQDQRSELAGDFSEARRVGITPPRYQNEVDYLENLGKDFGLHLSEGGVVAGCAPCGSALLYANHALYNYENVLNVSNRPDHVTDNFLMSALRQVGIDVEVPGPRVYGPGSIFLPGSFWHDFGMRGVLVGALMHATLLVGFFWLLAKGGVWPVVAFPGFAKMAIVSLWLFMGFAPNIMVFPFVVFGFAVVGVALARREKA